MQKQEVIYSITCLVNNKVYIGRTCEVNRRKREHFKKLTSGKHCNKHLQASFNKHGKDSFVFNVIEIVNNSCVKSRELFWFNEMNSKGVSLFNHDMTGTGGIDSKSKVTRTYIFDVISEMYSKGTSIKAGAKLHKTSTATILSYIPEWESLTSNRFCRTPQEDACLKRMKDFVEDWWKEGDSVTRNLKGYGLSYQSLIKYLPLFGLSFDDVRLDAKFKSTEMRAIKALEDVKQGIHFTVACKNNDISIPTFYKYKELK